MFLCPVYQIWSYKNLLIFRGCQKYLLISTMIIAFISSIRIDIGLSGPNCWPLPIAIFGVWCRRQRSMVTSTPVIWHFSRKKFSNICFTTFFLYWNVRTGTKTWLEQWKPWKKQFDERIFPGFLSLFWVVFKGVPFCDDHWGRRRFYKIFTRKVFGYRLIVIKNATLMRLILSEKSYSVMLLLMIHLAVMDRDKDNFDIRFHKSSFN